MIRKQVPNEFYNSKFNRVNVNIDSIERSSGNTGQYKIKLQQRLLNVKGVRLASAEVPNTIYSVTDPLQYVIITGTDSSTFFPFMAAGNYSATAFGYGNKNLGYSFVTASGAVIYCKWLYEPASMKLSLYSNQRITLSCPFENLSRILGMKKDTNYTSYDLTLSSQNHYIVSDGSANNFALNPKHPKYAYIQAYTGRNGTFPPEFVVTPTLLNFRIDLPFAVNFNPTPYVYLTIKEFEPYYDKYAVAAPADAIGNGNLAKIPLTSELGQYVFYMTFRRIDTTEFFCTFDGSFDIDSLTVSWYDAFGNVVDFNGVDHSFVLEVLQTH